MLRFRNGPYVRPYKKHSQYSNGLSSIHAAVTDPFGPDNITSQHVPANYREIYRTAQANQHPAQGSTRIKIPVRQAKSEVQQEQPAIQEDQQPVEHRWDSISQADQAESKMNNNHNNSTSTGETNWKAVARQLQADMENFRKRQQRQAEEAAQTERVRLLRLILPLADNLARALDHGEAGDDGLHQGIELTQRELSRLLAAEGVTRIETVGQAFDPSWHEALATVPHQRVDPNTIIEEVEAGYKIDDKLLRPARVVVAT